MVLINRDKLLTDIREYINEYSQTDENGNHSLKWCAMHEALDCIMSQPEVKPKKTTDKYPKETYDEILGYLNKACRTKFKPCDTYKKHINARLDDGYTIDDFKTVIDKKSDEWIDTEMEKYLRPQTLFNTKFESYLNQRTSKKKNAYDDWSKA